MAVGYQDELETALRAAVEAAAYLRGAYEAFEVIPDARVDITTEADRQSQERILQCIRRAFPGDALCAEEQTPTAGLAPRTGPRQWVVDPIDGTRGFAQKNGEFSVMIGFVAEGRAVLGVVAEPTRDRVTYATRGEGCWMRTGQGQPVRCQVTATGRLDGATLTQSRTRDPGAPSVASRLLAPARIVETHSAGLKLALVARGEADLYVNHYPNFYDWDICAGHVLVEEAGGVVTGMRGEVIQYGVAGARQRHGLLAANAGLHALALEKLRAGG